MDQVEEDLKRMKIVGWKAKVEDRQEWSRIVEQTKTHSGLQSQQKNENKNKNKKNWVVTRRQWLFYMFTKHEISY